MYCTNRIMDMLLVLLTFTMYYSTCMCLSSGLIFLQRPLGVQSLKKIVLTLNMYLSVLVTFKLLIYGVWVFFSTFQCPI